LNYSIARMTNTKTPYIILLILTVLLLCVYLYINSNLYLNLTNGYERFDNLLPGQVAISEELINLPPDDVHFITDNNLELITTPILNYKLSVLAEGNTRIMKYITVFMHQTFQYNNDDYTPVGQFLKVTDKPLDIEDINSNVMIEVQSKKCINYLCSSQYYPVDYKLVWTSDTNTDGAIFSVWKPITLSGFVSMSDVIVAGVNKPELEYITCLPLNILTFSGISNGILWQGKNDMGKGCFCWSASNFDTFRSSNIYSENMLELMDVYHITKERLDNFTLTHTTPTDKQIVNGILI